MLPHYRIKHVRHRVCWRLEKIWREKTEIIYLLLPRDRHYLISYFQFIFLHILKDSCLPSVCNSGSRFLFSLNIIDLHNYRFHWLGNVPSSDLSSLLF